MRIAPDHTIAYANGRFADMIGASVAALTGTPVRDLIHRDDIVAAHAQFEARRAGLAARDDLRLVRTDGAEIWTAISSAPVHDASGAIQGALAMVTDISDRRALEAEARQGLKMEAMSRTASAVAHDFNNRLTVIRSVAGLRRDAGGAAPRLHEDMDEILGAVDRGASLSAHRLAFCRAQPAEPQAVDLGALLVADPLQLEQVLLDLASNAADVMPFGGELRIRAAPRTVDDAVPSRYGATAPGTYATLTVTDTDTGTGMTLEVLARPGEPFLSTKPQGRGTGLGLATVYGIVQQPGGGLTVESTPGIGTSITVYLPSAGTAA